MGGAWERLIYLTWLILFALMNEEVVTDRVLNTLITEVKSILNSRPLVPVTIDSDYEPLTPIHEAVLRILGPFDKIDSDMCYNGPKLCILLTNVDYVG